MSTFTFQLRNWECDSAQCHIERGLAADEIEHLEKQLAEARKIADESFDLLAKDARWGKITKLEKLNAALMECYHHLTYHKDVAHVRKSLDKVEALLEEK